MPVESTNFLHLPLLPRATRSSDTFHWLTEFSRTVICKEREGQQFNYKAQLLCSSGCTDLE